MRQVMRRRRLPVVLVLTLLFAGCASAPPNLSPAGATAFTNLRIQKGMDAVRDIAVSANEQNPPLLPVETTRKIVTWHRSAITLLHERSTGWANLIAVGLDELVRDLPPAQSQLILPYVALVKTLLAEVTQ